MNMAELPYRITPYSVVYFTLLAILSELNKDKFSKRLVYSKIIFVNISPNLDVS